MRKQVTLDEEAFGQVGRNLRSHRLYTVHDFLLVADEGDPERGQLFHCQPHHSVHTANTSPLEIVHVTRHFYRR